MLVTKGIWEGYGRHIPQYNYMGIGKSPNIFYLFLLYTVKIHRNDGFRMNSASKTFGGRAPLDYLGMPPCHSNMVI